MHYIKQTAYSQDQHTSFTTKVLICVGITLISILLILLLGYAFHVVLLLLAGILVAVFFRGLAHTLAAHTPLSEGLSLAVVITSIVGITLGAYFLLAPQVSGQTRQLSETLPKAVEKIKTQAENSPWVSKVMEEIANSNNVLQNKGSWLKKGFGVLSGLLGVVADLYVILFLGIFLTAQPALYQKGIVKLFPLDKRSRATDVLDALSSTLYKWIIGKLCSMFLVGVLTVLGLWLLGIPMAVALGLFAAIATFVPNFGPIIALVPAALIALLQGPTQALYVIALYMGIQAVESNLLTPLIQKKMVAIPPALIITGQLLLGVFTGVLGLVLATPIMVIVLVLVKMLYISDVLGDKQVEV